MKHMQQLMLFFICTAITPISAMIVDTQDAAAYCDTTRDQKEQDKKRETVTVRTYRTDYKERVYRQKKIFEAQCVDSIRAEEEYAYTTEHKRRTYKQDKPIRHSDMWTTKDSMLLEQMHGLSPYAELTWNAVATPYWIAIKVSNDQEEKDMALLNMLSLGYSDYSYPLWRLDLAAALLSGGNIAVAHCVADHHKKIAYYIRYPLHTAVCWGDEPLVRLLLTHHADVQCEEACLLPIERAKETAIAQLLVQRGALDNPSLAIKNLLHDAARNKTRLPELITFYRSLGFSPLARGSLFNGASPLMGMVYMFPHTEEIALVEKAERLLNNLKPEEQRYLIQSEPAPELGCTLLQLIERTAESDRTVNVHDVAQLIDLYAYLQFHILNNTRLSTLMDVTNVASRIARKKWPTEHDSRFAHWHIMINNRYYKSINDLAKPSQTVQD